MTQDINHNREILTLRLEQGSPSSVDWSPDGTRLVVGDDKGGVQVFTADGKQLWRCKEHTGSVQGISWAPDSLRIASASSGNNMILVYDADSGTVLLRAEAGTGNWKVTWSPDSRRLAWYVGGSRESFIVRVFDAETGTPLQDCEGHTQMIWSVSWFPHGHLLASGSGGPHTNGSDPTVRIWDTRDGKCVHTLEGHTDAIVGLILSPDGTLLASASWDHTLRVWDTLPGTCKFVCEGHEGIVWSVDWSPDGRILASGSNDKTIRLWNARTGNEILRLDQPERVLYVAFSPYGTRLASTCDDGYVRLWDVSDLVQIQKTAVLDTPFQQYIAMQAATIGMRPPAPAKKEPWVPHLPEAEGECLGVLRYPKTGVGIPSVAIFPDCRSIATGHSDGNVHRWDLYSGAILWQGNEKHSDDITDTAVSPDGARIATASDDKNVRIWDAQTGQCLRQFKGYKNEIIYVRWSPDGKHLVSLESSGEKQLCKWEVDTGECLWGGEGHNELTQGLDWSSNGSFLATGDHDGNIVIWDAISGQNLHRFNCYNGVILNLRWSPDNHSLLTGFSDGTVLVVNPFDESIRIRLQGHTDCVSALDWSRDGCFIATGARDDDQTLRVWDAATGLELKRFTFDDEGCLRLAFSPDNAFIVASLWGLGVKGDTFEELFRIYDTRDLLEKKTTETVTTAPPPAPSLSLNSPLPEHLRHLPAALSQMHRLTIYPPLSLVRDLLLLLTRPNTGSTSDASDTADTPGFLQSLFKQNPGLLALRDLRWPYAARIGLVAFLLHRFPPTQWKPPAGSTPSQVRDALLIALTGDPIEPKPPAPPISLLSQAANQIDDRLLTLLSFLGPDAVAADPGLPLRLLPRVKEIPPLSISQRRCLGIHTGTPHMSGQSTGLVPGAERGQIGDIQMGPLRSDFTSLLPSQLAMPPTVQMFRHLRSELLFRAREMAEPPRIRPAVILLDVSPPTFGPIEKITRLAAFSIAQSLRRAGQRVILLTNSDGIKEGQWLLELNHPPNLLETWLQRTLKSIPASRSLELARVLRAGLQENDGLEPIILVLSHPWFGADEEIPEMKGLRGLFVQYPHYPVVPVLAGKCEKWRTIETTQPNELTSLLAQLMT